MTCAMFLLQLYNFAFVYGFQIQRYNGYTLFVLDTTWDPPDEYISLAQQEEQKLKEKAEEMRKENLK